MNYVGSWHQLRFGSKDYSHFIFSDAPRRKEGEHDPKHGIYETVYLKTACNIEFKSGEGWGGSGSNPCPKCKTARRRKLLKSHKETELLRIEVEEEQFILDRKKDRLKELENKTIAQEDSLIDEEIESLQSRINELERERNGS